MVNGRTNVDGGVGHVSDEEEVDEISEQVHSGLLPEHEGLDDFLRQMHHETATGTSLGMPDLLDLKAKFKTKSATIRHLYDKGFAIKDISKHLGLRYQHVRNVLTTQLKRGPNESWHTSEDESKRMSSGLDKFG